MISRAFIVLFLICGHSLLGAVTSTELLAELDTALKMHDRVAFENCANFEGIDKDTRESFSKIEDEIFSWPSHYILIRERTDHGKMHALRDGKYFTLNGDWASEVGIYMSKPPSKGYVISAGLVNGKYKLLFGVPEEK